MFTWGRIVLSSSKRAHVDWNWPISWEKISKNRLVCKNAVALAYYGSCRLLVMGSWLSLASTLVCNIYYRKLVYLKDSNSASHFVNSMILFALCRTGILFAHAPQKNVSNRWYAPALQVRKSQNASDFNKFFGDVSLCNLCERVRNWTKWFCGVS